MALQIPDPRELEQTIKLLVSDESGETWVRVKQATTGDDALISSLWAKTAWEFDDAARGKVKQYNDVSRARIVGEQVRCTLLECNITDHQGSLLFPSVDYGAMPRQLDPFAEAWSQLPSEWAEEIHGAVLKANPQWGRSDQEGEA